MPGENKKSKTVQKPAAQKPAAQKPAAQKPSAPKTSMTKPMVQKPVQKVTVQKSSAQKTQAGQYAGSKDAVKKNKPVKTKESTKKQSMLNTHKLAPFKYDMNEILSESRMDPAKASSFLASVIAKASRISTKAAKEFVKTFLDAEDLTKEEYDKICKLLDRYSKFR